MSEGTDDADEPHHEQNILEHSPPELLYEVVLSFLHPLALLHLSRCSKFLRGVLLSKHSRLAWTNACQNVVPIRPPPCPEGMSEPAHAALLFEKFCEVCGRDHAGQPDYAARKRICRHCRRNLVAPGREMVEEFRRTTFVSRQRARELYDLVPVVAINFCGFLDGHMICQSVEDVIQFHNGDWWETLLNECEPFTSEDWDNVQWRLCPHLDAATAARLAHLNALIAEEEAKYFKTRFRARRAQLRVHYTEFLRRAAQDITTHTAALMPGFADAEDLPAMHALVEGDGDPTARLGWDAFAEVAKAVVEEAQDGVRDRIRALADLVRRHSSPQGPNAGSPHGRSGSGDPPTLEDDLAALEASTALFTCRCERIPAPRSCGVRMPFLALLQHWQRYHGRWKAWHVRVVDGSPAVVARLRASLVGRARASGEGTTHGELERLVRERRPRCACGERWDYDGERAWTIVGEILEHLHAHSERRRFPFLGLFS
ncbi:uncharacterized protein BXZ73DRAFT_103698 [Epithele typhae]|uniref:uncharacterized protein n=1 Tax=Epithele typhae TaxID=378194 RepID=UPI002008BA45|nr:uncharacterized protein BXZ73DRAFT_103698 [Epithele typhae]KAH9923966.1 hypothetical protein BXZ73DRAFT_103698 [Epithele typhae]